MISAVARRLGDRTEPVILRVRRVQAAETEPVRLRVRRVQAAETDRCVSQGTPRESAPAGRFDASIAAVENGLADENVLIGSRGGGHLGVMLLASGVVGLGGLAPPIYMSNPPSPSFPIPYNHTFINC